MRISIAIKTFNRRTSLLTSKLDIEFRKKCYVWSIALYGLELTLRKLEPKYFFEIWRWRRMKKVKWSEKVTNEQVVERIGEKRILLNNIQ